MSVSRMAMCALGAQLLVATSAQAQVDPRGTVRTFTTTHFRVHFALNEEALARRAAVLAEQAWRNLAGELAAPAAPVDLLIADNTDFSNGFAQVYPTNRVVVYVVPPVFLSELRFHDEWLELVITHELAHIFHLDRARGLWRVGRFIFGRNSALFPNSYTPSWVKEGLAVHYESQFTGSGRIVSTDFRLVSQAAARDGHVPAPGDWSLSTTRYPEGEMAYAWGAQLMHREATVGGDSGMRRFVDRMAAVPIPFLLNAAAQHAFGESFATGFRVMRDSAHAATVALDTSGDARWQPVTAYARSASHPRWRSADTLEWVAAHGRDLTGVYRVVVPASASDGRTSPRTAPLPGAPFRIARRNSLDVNAPMRDGRSVFAQVEYRDPYIVSNDLYVREANGREHRLTSGARLTQPDVRGLDGAIVAIQIVPGGTRIARVSPQGVVTPLVTSADADWGEVRWSPEGHRLVSVQLTRDGVQRIVLLDTTGTITHIIASTRAVVASPGFTPDGRWLVWSSDRSGRSQLEIAIAPASNAPADTNARAEVREASHVTTGVFEPSVSPDGRRVAALVYRDNGYHLSVAPLDTTGSLARDRWYVAQTSGSSAAASNAARTGQRASAQRDDSARTFTGASTPYRAWRQLLPRYWMPSIGQARDGGSNYGAYTGAIDILGRHAWDASALVNPRNGETDGALSYQYARFGATAINASVSQTWDATFGVLDTAGRLLGTIARRRQFATASLSWFRPRIRLSTNAAIGAQYERRHYEGTPDALLDLPGVALRGGRRYPSLFAGGGIATTARASQNISVEQGLALSGTVSWRKREGETASDSWRTVGALRAYQPLELPGFARHVLAFRATGGVTDKNAPTEFSVGGVSGSASELLPGVSIGDPSRTFPLRGMAPGVQRGLRALAATAEYRAPLAMPSRGLGWWPVFFDRVSVSAFADAARAWCPASIQPRPLGLCEPAGTRDGWLASVGGEVIVDLALQYDIPYRARLGFAKPVSSPADIGRGATVYFTLGSFF